MRCVFWKNSLGLSQRRGEAAKRPQARGGGGGEPEDTGPGGWVGGSVPTSHLEKEPEQSISEGEGGDGREGRAGRGRCS